MGEDFRDGDHQGGVSGESGDPAGSGGRRGSRELSPLQRALGLLTRREHSRQELTRKLLAKGVASDEVETVVAKLADAGWQNDMRFAESRVRVRVGDGYGPLHIRAELATHGLDRDTIMTALDTFEGSWAENARDLVRRRYGEGVVDDLKLRRKASDLLMRRGFDVGCIRAATRLAPDDD
jgi:regulatory protein